jgi:hypothetical protein
MFSEGQVRLWGYKIHNNGVVIMGRRFEGVTAINNGCDGAVFVRIEFDSKQHSPIAPVIIDCKCREAHSGHTDNRAS